MRNFISQSFTSSPAHLATISQQEAGLVWRYFYNLTIRRYPSQCRDPPHSALEIGDISPPTILFVPEIKYCFKIPTKAISVSSLCLLWSLYILFTVDFLGNMTAGQPADLQDYQCSPHAAFYCRIFCIYGCSSENLKGEGGGRGGWGGERMWGESQAPARVRSLLTDWALLGLSQIRNTPDLASRISSLTNSNIVRLQPRVLVERDLDEIDMWCCIL